MKTPLDIYLQRHSPLLPELWLRYSRLSARYAGLHVPWAAELSPTGIPYHDLLTYPDALGPDN